MVLPTSTFNIFFDNLANRPAWRVSREFHLHLPAPLLDRLPDRFCVLNLLQTPQGRLGRAVWDEVNLLRAIDRYAQVLTVQIWSGDDFLGSGIWWQETIDRQGQVLTNAHVLRWAAPPYRIVTANGASYPAQWIGSPLDQTFDQTLDHGDLGESRLDLALLQVPQTPPVLPMLRQNPPPWNPQSRTLAAPFPVFFSGWFLSDVGDKTLKEIGEMTWQTTEARLVYHLRQPLRQGAHWAYTHQVHKGQSGGPVLDSQGYLLGINTIHARPLFPLGHFYEDGTQPDRAVQGLIDRYNWAIPSDRLSIFSQ